MADTRMSLQDDTGARWLWLAVFGLIILAWIAVFAMATANTATGFWAALCAPVQSASLWSLVLMWCLMVLAMMVPTFVPSVRTYLDLRTSGATSTLHAFSLIGGYALVWFAFAGIGASIQFALASANVLGPNGVSTSHWLTSALLIGAGVYQISPAKDACLTRCRAPLTYFIGRWRPGHVGALAMGVELGMLCVGCCWALMALAFVGGTMNMLWMGAATLFMILEKLPDIGRPLTKPLGAVLIGAGLVALV